MEIKNSKIRKSFLVAGIVVGLAGWSSLIWAFTTQTKEDNPVEEKVQVAAEPTKVKTDPNVESSIEAFLDKWGKAKGEGVKTLITENFDSVTGYYAYPVTVEKVGKRISLDLGLSTIEIPSQTVIAHKGFLDNVTNLKEGDNGLAIVKYDNNNITSVEVYQLNYAIADIGEAILNADFDKEGSTAKAKIAKEEKTYDVLKADEWKGMALLTSREIISSGMAPIFIVPTSSITASKDLTDTFYYIIAGTLESTSAGKTTLKSYEGKNVHLDFGVDSVSEETIGQPVWVHVVTKDGKIQNVELQSFENADLATMAEGLMTYISVAYAVHENE